VGWAVNEEKETAFIWHSYIFTDSYASRNVLARFGKTSRDARGCAVCKHEGRNPTTMTDYCSKHKVCLCRKLYTRYEKNNEGFYLETSQESED
jgi:hypothetical protein